MSVEIAGVLSLVDNTQTICYTSAVAVPGFGEAEGLSGCLKREVLQPSRSAASLWGLETKLKRLLNYAILFLGGFRSTM